MKQLALAAALLMFAAPALALDPPEPPAQQNPMGTSGDYLYYHPDQGHRLDGLKAFSHGHFDVAIRDFRAGARFADKPSQAMVASMYWDGQGVPKDRALAYAWMDLAAERGYPWLVATRERYWGAMTDDEHQRALEAGKPLYAEYGDAAARPRLEAWLRRGTKQVTGSHTGFVGTLDIDKMDSSGRLTRVADANGYYAARYWKAKDYWRWSGGSWYPNQNGKVTLGELHPESGAASGPDAADPPPKPEQH